MAVLNHAAEIRTSHFVQKAYGVQKHYEDIDRLMLPGKRSLCPESESGLSRDTCAETRQIPSVSYQ